METTTAPVNTNESTIDAALIAHINTLLSTLETGLFERGAALRLCFAAAIASESVFLYGPPGTAKSLVARRLSLAFANALTFDYLMGRFSTPEEIFGPVSIAKLRDQDRYERKTDGYLPRADIVFLDEIWKASPPIQNALLTALNEKLWRNGDQVVSLPLKCLIAASNETGADPSTAAFWDRFLVRIPLAPLQERAHVEALLSDTHNPLDLPLAKEAQITPETWSLLQQAVDKVTIPSAAMDVFIAVRNSLTSTFPASSASDRRWKKAARLIRAISVMHGRTSIQAPDFQVLAYCLWNKPEEFSAIDELVASAVRTAWFAPGSTFDQIDRAATNAGTNLGSSSLDGDLLVVDGEYYVLENNPDDGPGTELRVWKLDVEGLDDHARTIDVFVYKNGSYRNSKAVEARSSSKPHDLLLNGFVRHLKSRDLEPSGSSGTDSLDQRNELKTQAQVWLSEALAKRHSALRDAQSHHFYRKAFFDAVLTDLDAAIEHVGSLVAKLTKP